ncbi:hypothetical protein [Candidatus Pelagibacter sp.]|uniref:hypothetical protein n=1 Tax=Candidatus Pelagibacter sp. TaxID=2024849 RepID=UPI003F86D60A
MKKIFVFSTLGILILFSFFIIFTQEKSEVKKAADDEAIAIFAGYKPLSNLNMYIGSKVADTFEYLLTNLKNECSVLYGEKMEIKGKIKVDTVSDDISRYKNEKNIQVLCKGVKYEFLDINGDPLTDEIELMFNSCNNSVLDYYISSDLKANLFGNNPKIFDEWVSYLKNYSSKNSVIERKIIEDEFLGIKTLYNVNRKYWYHELNPLDEKGKEIKKSWPLYGTIFLEIINKKKIENTNDLGTNNIKFRSYLSHIARAKNC